MTAPVTTEIISSVAVLTMNSPPVNALSLSLRQHLQGAFRAALADANVKAIVITGVGKLFSGGADIAEFKGELGKPGLSELLCELEASPKLLIAALNGTALGGGLELALACHARICVTGAQLGLPEVTLGIIPGAGGTQRLPRLIGVEAAADMITSGKPISTESGLERGLIDVIVPAADSLRQSAIAMAIARLATAQAPSNARGVPLAALPSDPDYFTTYRKTLVKSGRGLVAPTCALDAIEMATRLPLTDGLKAETEIFQTCNASDQGRALQHIFFSQRKVAHVRGLPADASARPITSVGIIGAGTMGGGIAMNFLNAGIPVTLLDVNAASLERGLATIKKNYDISVARGRFKAEQVEAWMALLTGTQSYSDLGSADLIIEAAFEKMDIKKAIFVELDRVAKPGAILATNTSTLDVNEIAAATGRPQDVIGMHFFSPANVMRLVEIVRGDASAPDAIKTALDVCKRLGKIGVVVGVCFGFVGNRMLEPYAREGHRLLLEGADAGAVDKVLTDFGLSMGIFSMYDLAGIDVGAAVRRENTAATQHDISYCRMGDVLAEQGDYGQKTSRGFYVYEGRNQTPNPDLPALVVREAERLGIHRRHISDQEIFERCLFPLVDEGLTLLEDGIAQRPGDIDIVWCNGYGFPSWRGGPMHWADVYGCDKILTAMEGYRRSLGEYGEMWFRPSKSLRDIAKRRGKITDLFSNN